MPSSMRLPDESRVLALAPSSRQSPLGQEHVHFETPLRSSQLKIDKTETELEETGGHNDGIGAFSDAPLVLVRSSFEEETKVFFFFSFFSLLFFSLFFFFSLKQGGRHSNNETKNMPVRIRLARFGRKVRLLLASLNCFSLSHRRGSQVFFSISNLNQKI